MKVPIGLAVSVFAYMTMLVLFIVNNIVSVGIIMLLVIGLFGLVFLYSICLDEWAFEEIYAQNMIRKSETD